MATRLSPHMAVYGLAVSLGVAAAILSIDACRHATDSNDGSDSVVEGPILECPDVVVCSECEQGQIAQGEVTVANRGRRELVIHSVRTSCSCAGLERWVDGRLVRVETLTVGPGVSVPLVIRQAVNDPPGQPVHTALYFGTNDPAVPEKNLRFQVDRVTAGLRTVPSSIGLGTILVGTQSRHVVLVYDANPVPRAVLGARNGHPDDVSATVIGTDHFGALGGAAAIRCPTTNGSLVGCIDVSLHGSRRGRVDDAVVVLVDGGRELPLAVPITVDYVNPVEVWPSRVTLPRMSGNGPINTITCVGRVYDAQPATLKLISQPHGCFVRVEEATNGTPTIHFSVTLADPVPITTPDTPSNIIFEARVGDRTHPVKVPFTRVP